MQGFLRSWEGRDYMVCLVQSTSPYVTWGMQVRLVPCPHRNVYMSLYARVTGQSKNK